MTHVPASSHTVFNGGTITSPLIGRMANKDDVAFAARPVAGATADQTDQLEWYDDTGALLGYIDANGNFQHDGGSGTATTGAVGFSTARAALVLRGVGNAVNYLRCNNQSALALQAAGGTDRVRIDDNGIGFYNHAPATQQTLHSATATPEQIALALEANGVCGGD